MRSKRAALVDRQNTIHVGHVTSFMGQNPALRFGLGLHHCGSTRKSEIEFRIEPRRSRLPYTPLMHLSQVHMKKETEKCCFLAKFVSKFFKIFFFSRYVSSGFCGISSGGKKIAWH